jgi:hypothetical protein
LWLSSLLLFFRSKTYNSIKNEAKTDQIVFTETEKMGNKAVKPNQKQAVKPNQKQAVPPPAVQPDPPAAAAPPPPAPPKKPTLEMDVDYLNHQLFFVILFALFAANTSIWLYLGT